MKTLLLCVALLQASLYHQVSSRSSGAPAEACATLAPAVASHLNAQPQTTPVPYSIDLDPFCSNGTYQYYPGMSYTLSLHGENDMPQFRGVLIQARPVLDDNNPVGIFAVNGDSMDNTRLSLCATDTDGITHSNGNDKSSVYFDWTAPANGTGTLRFGFAVVQTRAVYWANQRSEMIVEAGTDGVGTACQVTTEPAATTAGASQLTSIGFSTLLMVALAVAIKVAL